MRKTMIKRWTLGLLCLAWLVRGAPAESSREGQPLPNLESFALQGQLPPRAGKVVLLDFWASWCAPCKASFPVLDRMYRTYKDRGFVILAVNVDDDPADMEKFLADHPVSFPIVHDARKRLVEQMAPEAMPTSYLAGRDGRIQVIHEGFKGKETEDALRAEIEKLLGAP